VHQEEDLYIQIAIITAQLNSQMDIDRLSNQQKVYYMILCFCWKESCVMKE